MLFLNSFFRVWIPGLLLAGLIAPGWVLGNLPPSAYEAMQQNAPESLKIEVLRVEAEPGTALDEELIRVTAVVTGVERSATDLRVGDSIQIVYALKVGRDGRALGGQPPRLSEGFAGPAFLAREVDAPVYHPVAFALSFERF